MKKICRKCRTCRWWGDAVIDWNFRRACTNKKVLDEIPPSLSVLGPYARARSPSFSCIHWERRKSPVKVPPERRKRHLKKRS